MSDLRQFLARVERMDREEVVFRARVLARRGLERTIASVHRPRWSRAAIRSALDLSRPDLTSVRRALRGRDVLQAHRALAVHFRDRPPRFLVAPRGLADVAERVRLNFPSASTDAAARVERILGAEYDLLGYQRLHFGETAPPAMSGAANARHPWTGTPVDWHVDPVTGRRPARGWWSDIAYLDSAGGDHKIIWELNRHQHWLALGRAAWLTGDARCRARFVSELAGWLRANPPLTGINWASMLELSLRTISWIWALHFFTATPEATPGADDDTTPWVIDLLLGIDRQMRHVERNLSSYFSPNTHLTGEALALYVAGSSLPELKGARRWTETGRRILMAEAHRQILRDGGHAERSTHYHRYSLDFYLMALSIASLTGDMAGKRAFERAVVRQARYATAMADSAGRLPLLGDDDGGSLVPLCGRDPADIKSSLGWATALVPSLALCGAMPTEEVAWLTSVVPGRRVAAAARGAVGDLAAAAGRSAALSDSGYYVSRSRFGDHLVVDAGPHGYLNGGHAHADALSLVLSVRGVPLLVDPGTGTYTMDPAQRDYFRSSQAHNTLTLDHRSQSIPDGPFHWRSGASGRLLAWRANGWFDYFEGSENAYAPAVHLRRVFSSGPGDRWLVVDEVIDDARHHADVHWHIHPAWHAEVVRRGCMRLEHPDGLVAWLTTTAPMMTVFRGDGHGGAGWFSPAYGVVLPCSTIAFSFEGAAPFSIASMVVLGEEEPRDMALEVLPAQTDGGSGRAGEVRLVRQGSMDLAMWAQARPDADERAQALPPRGPCWRASGFETDARFLHAQLTPDGQLVHLAIVDGSFVTQLAAGGARIEIASRCADLALSLNGTSRVHLASSAAIPSLHLFLPDAPLMQQVEANGAPVRFTHAPGSIKVRSDSAASGRTIVEAAPAKSRRRLPDWRG